MSTRGICHGVRWMAVQENPDFLLSAYIVYEAQKNRLLGDACQILKVIYSAGCFFTA